jgi:hypothetical protein
MNYIAFVSWAGFVMALASAFCWVMAARIKTPLPMGYVSGPPTEVVRAVQSQSRWNALAAVFAAGTVLCQGLSLLLPQVSK